MDKLSTSIFSEVGSEQIQKNYLLRKYKGAFDEYHTKDINFVPDLLYALES